MAHFAKVENGIVTQVIVVNNETLNHLEFPDSEPLGKEFIASLGLDGEWIQTSYNDNFRSVYAGIGFTYNEQLDAFIMPKPYNSWILNEDTCRWEAPVPMPDGLYTWNEETTSWELINDN